MQYLRKPFPIRRTTTITRVNVERALAEFPELLDTPAKIAMHFVGTSSDSKRSLAKPRHVCRVIRLLARINRKAVNNAD